MPRSLQEILDHADDLATRFEDYEPDPDDERDPEPHRALVAAVAARSRVEQEIAGAVQRARAAGYTWADIGALLGTTGQAASQRYGRRVAA
jgi:hypothetical protein